MENEVSKVIDELAKINQAAGNYAGEMGRSRDGLMKEYESKRADYAKTLREEAEARVAAHRENLEKEAAESEKKLRADSEEYIKSINAAYEEHHSEWAREIAEKIASEH